MFKIVECLCTFGRKSLLAEGIKVSSSKRSNTHDWGERDRLQTHHRSPVTSCVGPRRWRRPPPSGPHQTGSGRSGSRPGGRSSVTKTFYRQHADNTETSVATMQSNNSFYHHTPITQTERVTTHSTITHQSHRRREWNNHTDGESGPITQTERVEQSRVAY